MTSSLKTTTGTENAYLNTLGMVTTLGVTLAETCNNISAASGGLLTQSEDYSSGEAVSVGQVAPELALPSLEQMPLFYQTRNNQLLAYAYHQIEETVQQAVQQYGPSRVGIVLGTSTSGIATTERAYQQYQRQQSWPDGFSYKQQAIDSPASFLSDYAGIHGPAYVISSACSSGAKALASASRLVLSGICDAVICGGVDSLCRLTIQGFAALGALSRSVANPMSINRDGINIGEGAALFVLSGVPSGVRLAGAGETSDAHHISAPDPEGAGAIKAMSLALQDAGIEAAEIQYVNLHGTATQQNDAMEAKAIQKVFGSNVLCSSTKPMTGHCLGAAGAIEAGILFLSLQGKTDLPVHLWDGCLDETLETPLLVNTDNQRQENLRFALSNSFAFGGSNIALVMESIVDQ